MIYVQLVYFLSPHQDEERENTHLAGYKSDQTTNHGGSYIYNVVGASWTLFYYPIMAYCGHNV
jgi:outer membrane protease